MKRVEEEPQKLEDFHKDIIFYEYEENIDKKDYWWEYKARFTNGLCKKIELIKYQVVQAKEPYQF